MSPPVVFFVSDAPPGCFVWPGFAKSPVSVDVPAFPAGFGAGFEGLFAVRPEHPQRESVLLFGRAVAVAEHFGGDSTTTEKYRLFVRASENALLE